jgi:hypothetical protein
MASVGGAGEQTDDELRQYFIKGNKRSRQTTAQPSPTDHNGWHLEIKQCCMVHKGRTDAPCTGPSTCKGPGFILHPPTQPLLSPPPPHTHTLCSLTWCGHGPGAWLPAEAPHGGLKQPVVPLHSVPRLTHLDQLQHTLRGGGGRGTRTHRQIQSRVLLVETQAKAKGLFW